MRALVTGATGFVGSHLVEALQAHGARVTALVRAPARAAALNWRDVRLVAGDLHDPASLEAAVRGQDVVFHLAAKVAARNQQEFDRANLEGTANLLAAAGTLARGPRLVFVSSLAAAGPALPGAPHSGDEPPRPVTQYGRSKLAAEALVRASSLAWTIVRPPMVYGPRDREVLRVFRLAAWGVAPLLGSGRQELSAVFGPDLAAALLAVALNPGTTGQVYVACHDERFTSAQFLHAVGEALTGTPGRTGRKRVRLIPIPEPLGRRLLRVTGSLASLTGRPTLLTADKANELFAAAWTGDPAPLTRDTGWRARHDLVSGLALTAEWYRAAGWL